MIALNKGNSSIVFYLWCVSICLMCVPVAGIEGKWVQHYNISNYFSTSYPWRGSSSAGDSDALIRKEFLSVSTCRPLTLIYDCFSYNLNRSLEVMSRHWVPVDLSNVNASSSTTATKTGNEFNRTEHWIDVATTDPRELLGRLKGQTVLFIGDSTVLQMWQSLVCLFNSVSTANFEIGWLIHGSTIIGGNDPRGKECPGEPSCHVLGATAHFAEFGLHISYNQLNTYEHGSLRRFIQQFKLHTTDYIFFNFGLHYSVRKKFESALHAFKTDLIGVQYDPQTDSIPTLYWLETLPQHFKHAEFEAAEIIEGTHPMNHSATCTPYGNLSHAYTHDWRNRLVESHVPELVQNNKIVELAAPLYDQWDAHLDIDKVRSKSSTVLDCTHYCHGAGVFQYLTSKILSTLIPAVEAAAAAKLAGTSNGSTAPMPYYSPILLKNGTLVKAGSERVVYMIQNNASELRFGKSKRPIWDVSVFVKNNWDFSEVRTVASLLLEKVPIGTWVV